MTGWRRPALVAAAALVWSAMPGAGQPPRFRSGADAVRVDVRVTRGNTPVAGLTADHFELRDTGVRQKIEAVAIEDVPVSLLLALDVSRSVRGEVLADLKQAARAAVGALGAEDQALLLTFADRVLLQAPWTADRARLDAAIQGIEAAGGTSLHDALSAAIALRQRATGRPLLLVFTDGRDTTSWLEAPAIVDAIERSDVVVYAVSGARPRAGRPARTGPELMAERFAWRRLFRSEPSLFPEAFLETIAEDSGGQLLQAAASTDLARAFARAVADFKSRYLLTYSPQGVPATGWHPIEVKLRGASGTVTARRGYSR